jgi:chemotaxis protein CheD
MFVDSGISALFRAAYELRANKRRVQICVAGGAQFLDKSGFFNIGKRNYTCLVQLLAQHNLTIDAQEVGGLVSRTIHLHLDTGQVRLKSSGETEEIILFKGNASIG